jgi:putative DNA-invertase from lambdoid prophage Rac
MQQPRRVAIYTRVSTDQQTTENQIIELKQYCAARQWTVAMDYIDTISGSATSRPQLDEMLKDRRKFDAVVVWRLDRLGRSLSHLIQLLDEFNGLGVAFVSLQEGIDMTTPAGRFQAHILGAMAEFERSRIQERVISGIARARKQGKQLGRRRSTPLPEGAEKGLTVREAARRWGCSPAQACRRLKAGQLPPSIETSAA